MLVADRSALDFPQALALMQQFERLRRFLLVWCGDAAAADNLTGESGSPAGTGRAALARAGE